MPSYSYKCVKCETLTESNQPITGFKTAIVPCCKCGSETKYTFVPTVPLVSFIDGKTGSWPTKGQKFKKYREKRYKEMGKRQRDRYGEPKGAIPNYKGQECESWREAQSLAMKDKDRDERTVSSAVNSFNKKISEERAK